MSIQRTYSSGWSIGEKLTSAQHNALDIGTTYPIDKRAGQLEVFASMLVATGAGRVLDTVATGPDATCTFHMLAGNSIVRVPTLTSARSYMLGVSGATGGDRMLFYVEGTSGASPSGYAQIYNSVGTGIFRLGVTNTPAFNDSAEGDSAEFVFSGSEWRLMYGAGPGMRHVEFTSSTTWICPPGVYEVLVLGYGGGGGGGSGGINGAVVLNTSGIGTVVSGGGGGGGSQLRVQRVSVVPGRSYTITVGAGGVSDSDGGDSSFADLGLATTLASFAGASRGFRGGVATTGLVGVGSVTGGVTGTYGGLALGGAGVRFLFGTGATGAGVNVPTMIRIGFGYDPTPLRGPMGYGAGGPGVTPHFPAATMRHGRHSTEGFAGGTGGQHGANSGAGNSGGGGGGGGGGAGPAGVGGLGGTGGAATNSAVPFAGLGGGSGPANSGAGGGGGGGGAYDVGNLQVASAVASGGWGGSGKVSVVFAK